MLNVGIPELFVVAVLALLVFGPERLPELARNAARFINRFRSEATKSIGDLRAAADLGDLEDEVRSLHGELTGARDDIRDTLRGATKPMSPGGPTGSVPARASPPPIDTEAT